MRTLLIMLTLLVMTNVLGAVVILASLLGVRYHPDNIMGKAPRWWSRAVLRAGGVDVVLHHPERADPDAARIFVCNHVSWFDVVALAAELPRYSFVAKAEIFRVPVFGRGARAVGTIPIERENRKAAFAAYEEAAERIRGGDSVVVYPEGTRGATYSLRPFKKGPFVLAIASQAPVVPTIVHGTMEVLARDSWWARAGTVHVHFLEPVPTAGMTYDDREALAATVYTRMADALERLYGVKSPTYATKAA